MIKQYKMPNMIHNNLWKKINNLCAICIMKILMK